MRKILPALWLAAVLGLGALLPGNAGATADDYGDAYQQNAYQYPEALIRYRTTHKDRDFQHLHRMGKLARGKIDTIYLHWTAGSYGSVYDRYHINIGQYGEMYITCGSLTEGRPHTWHRNNRAIGITIDCMSNCSYSNGMTDWGNCPPTKAQIKTMACVVGLLAEELGLPVSAETVMTHAEAADLDGYGISSGESDCRWDLLELYDPYSGRLTPGGQLIRQLSAAHKALELEIGGTPAAAKAK